MGDPFTTLSPLYWRSQVIPEAMDFEDHTRPVPPFLRV
jgi:hypothetical protein